MTTVLLDTHALYWWSSRSNRLSKTAARMVASADELAVASITWFELAWLAHHERIALTIPLLSWLEELAAQVRTVGAAPAIAATAVSLPSSFPGDSADRLIYATAIEQGWPLVTKDERLRKHSGSRGPVVW